MLLMCLVRQLLVTLVTAFSFLLYRTPTSTDAARAAHAAPPRANAAFRISPVTSPSAVCRASPALAHGADPVYLPLFVFWAPSGLGGVSHRRPCQAPLWPDLCLFLHLSRNDLSNLCLFLSACLSFLLNGPSFLGLPLCYLALVPVVLVIALLLFL